MNFHSELLELSLYVQRQSAFTGLSFKQLLLLVSMMLCTAIPRFNGNQLLVKQQPYDSKYFESYVHYWRGEPLTQPLRPATNWRLLTPLLASILPFDPITAINVLNLFYLVASMLLLCNVLFLIGCNQFTIFKAGIIYSCSFPVFYYACIGYVEPGALFFLILSVHFTLKQKYFWYLLTLGIGLLCKETVVLSLAFFLVFCGTKTNIRFSIMSVLITVLIFYLVRTYAPVSDNESNERFWQFGWEPVYQNLHRLNTWLSFLLTVGPISAFCFPSVISQLKLNGFNRLQKAALASIVCCGFLYLMSYCTTVADGRILWQAYPYLLLLWASSQQRQSVQQEPTAISNKH